MCMIGNVLPECDETFQISRKIFLHAAVVTHADVTAENAFHNFTKATIKLSFLQSTITNLFKAQHLNVNAWKEQSNRFLIDCSKEYCGLFNNSAELI